MGIFNNLIEFVAGILAWFYSRPVVGGSYGLAIMLLTAAVMTILTPLTLKATRSTVKMQLVQPELRRIQQEYKGDRETMNAELMELYRDNGINPVGGCLPMVAQMPILLVLFRVLHGITTRTKDAHFFDVMNQVRAAKGLAPDAGDTITPFYLSHDTDMFKDLSQSQDMGFGPLDLALQARNVIQDNFFDGLPYLVLVLIMVATSYYQQRQISARRKEGDNNPVNQQQQMLLKILPLMSGVTSFIFPAGLVLYWTTSNIFRIGQQAYITHQIYGKELAEGGKISSTIKISDGKDRDSAAKRADVESKPAKAGVKSQKSTASSSKAAKSEAGVATEATSNGTAAPKDRNASWEKRRQAKTKARPSGQTSDRITPKGTKPQTKSKSNRKR